MGRFVDSTRGITDEQLFSDDGVQHIVDPIYEPDALSVLNDVYWDFKDLPSIRPSALGSFRSYEPRFAAQIARSTAHIDSIIIHESLLTMILLSVSNVDDAQPVPILSAAGGRSAVSNNDSNEKIMSTIKYEDIASVLRQYDNGISPGPQSTDGLCASSGRFGHGNFNGGRGRQRGSENDSFDRQRMTPAELRNYMLRCTCHQYGMKGHSATDHNADGSI